MGQGLKRRRQIADCLLGRIHLCRELLILKATLILKGRERLQEK
jgi:hypothetical protein